MAIISILAPARALLEGSTSPYFVETTAFWGSAPLISTSYTLGEAVFLSTPMPDVALAWASKSHRSTRFPRARRAAVMFTVVVVLPTPPFWLTTAMIFAIEYLLNRENPVRRLILPRRRTIHAPEWDEV